MVVAWGRLGVEPPTGLALDCTNEVPHGGGMGSSATAIVTGIVAAQALADVSAGDAGDAVDLTFANSLASRLEGTPTTRRRVCTGRLHALLVRRRAGQHHDGAPAGPPRRRAGRLRAGRHSAKAFGAAAAGSSGGCRGQLRAISCSRTPSASHPNTCSPPQGGCTRARRPSYAASMSLVDGCGPETTRPSSPVPAVRPGAGPARARRRCARTVRPAGAACCWHPDHGARVTVLSRA